MFRSPATLLLLGVVSVGCRKGRPILDMTPETANFNRPRDLATPQQAPSEPVAPPAAPAEVTRTEAPSSDELKKALDPHLPAIGVCMKNAGLPDLGVPLLLKILIGTEGMVMGATVVGTPKARPCVFSELREVRLPAWKGEQVLVTLPLDREGKPEQVPITRTPTDAAALP